MPDLRRVGPARLGGWARPPVWILVVSGSFCAYFALLVYCDLFRPVNPGFDANSNASGLLILSEVGPGTPASRAGMAVGDRLISINGVTIIDSDSWGALGSNYQIGVPMPVVVERHGARTYLNLLLPPETARYWLKRTGITLIVFRLAQLVTLLAAVVIAWRRPRDPSALAASWFLLTCAVFVIAMPYRLAIVWRELPIPLRELLWIPYASGLTIGPILLTFVTMFPSRVPYAGYVQAVLWATAGAAVASPIFNMTHLVYRGEELRSVGPGDLLLLSVFAVSLVSSVALSVMQYLRTNDLNERRRLRIVVAGMLVGALPGFSAIVYFWLLTPTNQSRSIFASPGMGFAGVALLAAPLSMTYAVLRHRMFDLSFIVRKWLRYALARGIVLSLVPAISGFMILETLRLRDQTVNSVLERRGALYLTLTAVAFAVFAYRRRWLKAIDRRFFRERHYAYAVLREVAEQVRRADSLESVAPVVVAKIESAMHPTFAALLVRNPSARVFRTITAAPSVSAPPDLPEDSKLAALARVVEQPLDTSADGRDSILHQIPAADLAFVRDARIETLVPVVTSNDELHALLLLGPKRSEEPYAQEDYGVLATIAENLGLLLARSAPRREAPALEECPECGTCYDGGTRVCSSHNRTLTSRGLPRTLAGRYRLDRRLAAGGMGTVYQALDVALERLVAAKVVRENLAGSDGALSRFVEEAKLAARLREHPNVVTVYDFGVIDGQQPFMIMELIVGRTLRHALEMPGELALHDAHSILEGICSAVSAAHRRGLIHRDLKPENIILAETDQGTVPKILDFGIAKPLSVATTLNGRAETDARVLIGTLEYMSPEQRRGGAPSIAWDLWSLAVIALEMLSGRPPASTSLTSLGPWAPGAVLMDTLPTYVDFFNRAMSIDPTRRPRDAETFFRALETLREPGR